jgi:hypothetical protein
MTARTRGLARDLASEDTYAGKAEVTTYRLNMSETISTSVSAAAIFSADEGCGRPPPNMLNDMTMFEGLRDRGALIS